MRNTCKVHEKKKLAAEPREASRAAQSLTSSLHRFSRGDLVQPKVVVFMAGIPGAGKTTVINRRHPCKTKTLVLDLDAELATHPRYDKKDPDKDELEINIDAIDPRTFHLLDRLIRGFLPDVAKKVKKKKKADESVSPGPPAKKLKA